jgi:isopenicillin N synthase-like dioxygenase
MITQIPVIDLSDALHGSYEARLAKGREMDRTCREVGFFTITGHGIPLPVIHGLRDQSNGFFGQTLADKLAAAAPDPDIPRGYRAMGTEALSQANDEITPPDLKEYYYFGREAWPDEAYFNDAEGRRYFIPNIWPAERPRLAAAAAAYYKAVEELATNMLQMAALGLGLPEHFFDDKVDRHISAVRINYYPAQHEAPAPGQLRAGAHTDYGLLTVLNGEDVPGGLQAQTRDGNWVDVHTNPDTFVVNIGDLMMRWTNDRWVSNVHRVVNPPPAAAQSNRLSIAFFHHPNHDALIECIAPPGEAKYPPVYSGEYRDLKYSQVKVAA